MTFRRSRREHKAGQFYEAMIECELLALRRRDAGDLEGARRAERAAHHAECKFSSLVDVEPDCAKED